MQEQEQLKCVMWGRDPNDYNIDQCIGKAQYLWIHGRPFRPYCGPCYELIITNGAINPLPNHPASEMDFIEIKNVNYTNLYQ
jgi:hypothetical protein